MDNHGIEDSNVPESGNTPIDLAQKVRKRTKTGCLTCRKRRIKCGEERPVCGNCVKSKRHCEGYIQRIVFKPSGEPWPGMNQMGSTHINIPISPHTMGLVPGYEPGQAFGTLPSHAQYGIPLDEHGNPIQIMSHIGSPLELSSPQYQLPHFPFSSPTLQPGLYAAQPSPLLLQEHSVSNPYFPPSYGTDSDMLPIQTQLPFMHRTSQVPMSDPGLMPQQFEQHINSPQMASNIHIKIETGSTDAHGIKRDSADPIDQAQAQGISRQFSGKLPSSWTIFIILLLQVSRSVLFQCRRAIHINLHWI
jgi:hypothetical protein